MTQKEKLSVELIGKRNEYYALVGKNSQVIEAVYDCDEARMIQTKTIDSIKVQINDFENLIKKVEKENKIKAWASTEEGRKIILGLINQKSDVDDKITELYEKYFEMVQQWIHTNVGETYMIHSFGGRSLEVFNHDGEDRIFGQSFEIYFEKNSWDGEERFEINFGSCGSFNMTDTSKSSFTAFHIAIGKMLSNKKSLEMLKDILFTYSTESSKLNIEFSKIDAKIKNPLAL